MDGKRRMGWDGGVPCEKSVKIGRDGKIYEDVANVQYCVTL